MTPDTSPAFQPLADIYEPSAIQQLPDGRFLVVEDEKSHPFSLFTIHLDGRISSIPLSTHIADASTAFKKLDDLEGLALDRQGNLYAITSHSRDGDGDSKKSRDKLVRFRIEADHIVDPRVTLELKPALLAAHPALAAAADERNVKEDNGLNIEALELSADQRSLLVGFRSPLLDGKAIIASINNHAAMFEADEPPQVSDTLITLDLAGNGIRGMAYVPSLNGYLVIAGPASRSAAQFQIWFWDGRPDAPARRASIPGLAGFEHAEGVSPAVVDGQSRLIIVSDDGDRAKQRVARFLLLDPAQLHIEH